MGKHSRLNRLISPLHAFTAALLTLLFLAATGSSLAEPPQTTLVWKGCSITKTAFMLECAKAYEEKTGVHIELIGGGATLGIRATVGGDSDIGSTCRPCRPDLFPSTEGDCKLILVAWDAICFITHPSNPVSNISSQQARDILTGKITNWSELGGPNQPIRLIYRRQTAEAKYSGVGYMTRKLLFHDANPDYAEKALIFRDSGIIERKVETMRWSFAADGFSSARKREVKILGIDGIPCDKENISTARYPYFRPLYIVTKGDPSGEAKKFVDWILSAEGQAVISAQGTVSLNDGRSLSSKYQAWEQESLILNKLRDRNKD